MKVAVITGAAQGIGRRTAEVLAEAGYALALLDVRSCEATLAAVRSAGADATEFVGDISDEGVVIRAARAVTKRWGRVDVLVNNAGISFITPAETMEVAGLSARAGGEPGGAVSAREAVWGHDAEAALRKHCECGVDCRTDGRE